MHIKSLKDIFVIIDELYSYLEGKEISLDKDGFPIFTNEMFLRDWPDLVIPFSQRKNKRVVNRKRLYYAFLTRIIIYIQG
ncbi:hypothetical protein SAMN02910429_01344 [Lachnobacterium bovis]|uniref:Uncharacterized protein n=1 Tax=Lachnobacterium bovis TaxID=140626 RepID=A0A1H9SR69_9FIRM|nr:hypothetical protein SAMN02910429_01344 [Lachnobacterium bovis]